MAVVYHEIYLPIDTESTFDYIVIKQGDAGTHRVRATLISNNRVYTIPTSGVSYFMKFRKPDNNYCLVEATVSDNTISAEVTEEMLRVSGTGRGEFMIVSGSDELKTATFHVKIVRQTFTSGDVQSHSDFAPFAALLQGAGAAASNANTAAAAANAAASLAEQKAQAIPDDYSDLVAEVAGKADQSTTYTKAQVDQMIEDVEVETDTTLAVSGAPADSAETGRQIGLLKADLNNFPDNRVITNYDAVPKTYVDIRIALTGTVVSGYIWNKSTGSQSSNPDGKYARFDNIGQYEVLYVSGADIDADHRLYAFYTANDTFISAKFGSGASGSVQVQVTVPENADYVIINTLYSTGDNGRGIDPACSALKVGEEDITANMLIAEGTVTEGYVWRPGQTPLQNSSCRYARYDTIPNSDYIYITGRAYRVSSPFISFYNNSDELISFYGANSLTYYEIIEMAVPAGTSYFIVNGTGGTPIVKYPASSSKKTQREVNEDVSADLADIRTILDNIDPLSDAVKTALLKCFEYVYWSDDRGHDAYEELKEALIGEEYIYKLEEPLIVDGTTGYLVTDVAPFTEDRSFTMFIDYTEGGRDWNVSSLIVDTIFQVKDVATNKNVIASSYKTANVSNVVTRISVFGIQYLIKQAKENAGNRRIKYGISYDAETGRYTAVISVNGTVISPNEDHTDTEVPFVETDGILNIGCNGLLGEILKGTINDLRILNHTTSLVKLTAYVTSLD